MNSAFPVRSDRCMRLLPIASAIVLITHNVGAQGLPATPPPALPSITIQSTKISEPLVGAPASITVLSAEVVEQNRIRAVEDLTRFVPNLKLDNGYGAGTRGFLSIRGVGNTPGSIDPSASIYVDDVPYHDFTMYSQPLFDVEQVEVLRGAQGTLYGGFAQAGVIDIRSRLPGSVLRRQAQADIYSRNGTSVGASLSGPFNDALSLGVSVLNVQGDSPIKNITLGKRSERETQAVRFQGVLNSGSDSQLVLTLINQRQRNQGGSDYLPVSRADYDAFAGVSTDDFEIANNIEGFQNLDTNGQSLRWRQRVDAVEYTLVAANRDTRSTSLVDFNYGPDNSGFFFASASSDRIANQHLEARARLVPASESDLDLTVGTSWMSQSYDVFNTVNLGATTYDVISAEGDNLSLFASARLPLNADGLSMLGGLRMERAVRKASNGPSDFRTAGFANIVAPTSVSSDQITWKFGFSQALAAGDVYAHVATGWRPGGVNYYTEDLTALTYQKERSISYEAGYRYASESLYVSAAAFFTRLSDYQESKVATSGAPGRGYLANVATVHIPGFELEFRHKLGGGLQTFGSVGYTRARFSRYPEFSALEGRPLGNRPDWNLSFGAQYEAGRMTYAFTGQAVSAFQSAYTSAGASTRVDGHLIGNVSVTYRAKSFEVTGYVDNIANREYFLNAGYYNYGTFGNPLPRGQVGAPRTIGIQVKAEF